MSKRDRERWEQRYREVRACSRGPSPLLVQHAQCSPGMAALDLACGLGHNALWMAAQGCMVVGVDISRVALSYAQHRARRLGLQERVLFVEADLDCFYIPPVRFDLICVIRFLNRALAPAICAALKPGGQLIAETLNWRRAQTHPDTPPEYLLGPGELLWLFEGLKVNLHEESGALSQLTARRP